MALTPKQRDELRSELEDEIRRLDEQRTVIEAQDVMLTQMNVLLKRDVEGIISEKLKDAFRLMPKMQMVDTSAESK